MRIFIADTDVAAVVKTRFFLQQKIYTHYILIAILKWKYKRSRPAKEGFIVIVSEIMNEFYFLQFFENSNE